MSLINSILSSAIQSREAYDLASLHAKDMIAELTGLPAILYSEISYFYEADIAASKCDIAILKERLKRKTAKHYPLFETFLDKVGDTSAANVYMEIMELSRQTVGKKLATSILAGDVNNSELLRQYTELSQGIDATRNTGGQDSDVFIDVPISSIINKVSGSGMIKIAPNELNEMLGGGVPRGTNITLFALVEMGKSLVAINIAAEACIAGHKVLYCANEEPAHSMIMRFMSRFTGLTKQQIVNNPVRAEEMAAKTAYSNLIFASLHPGTVEGIEKLIKKYTPDMVVVDQMRHLRVFGSKGETETLSKVGGAIRALGSKYNLVTLGIHQAADSATKKLVLDIGDMYMSNVSLPGDADVLIGVGANDEYVAEDKRIFTVIKNKISGMHGFFPVQVNRNLSKVLET